MPVLSQNKKRTGGYLCSCLIKNKKGEENKMKQKAMETRLIVRPLVGCLTHTHFWRDPAGPGILPT